MFNPTHEEIEACNLYNGVLNFVARASFLIKPSEALWLAMSLEKAAQTCSYDERKIILAARDYVVGIYDTMKK